ncbi:TolB family protein [Nocardiopsis composta]|uniref:Tol biopolymer transport system component n=1 Tax=Nocardiopsis composta TaxID=157465 RepID=A0A7W8QHT8_9ACTN|nr:PD40 domain-containing protein [Nocardiopsis composta]MBB5429990.1 Tol biopolymer transport system component [Nocardiopsis composta]
MSGTEPRRRGYARQALIGAAGAGAVFAGIFGTPPEPATAEAGAEGVPEAPIVFAADLAGTGGTDLYTVNGAGAPERITETAGNAAEPAWSPGRGEIAFTDDAGGPADLYAVGAGGGEPRRITEDLAEQGGPTWAPDGERIACSDDEPRRPPQESGVHVRAGGGDPVQLTEGGRDPDWDGGSHIAYAGTDGDEDTLYRVSADGGGPRFLAAFPGSEVSDPDWHPDGVRMLFWERTGSGEARLTVAGRDAGDPRAVFGTDAAVGGVSWSPSGELIAFAMDGPEGNGIYLLDAEDPGAPEKAVDLPGSQPVDLDWS